MAADAARRDLVDAIILLEQAGIVDFNGHASIRLPSGGILINSGQSLRNCLSVDDIVEIDADGRLVRGDAAPPMEFPIHTEIYRRRPDVGAVIHAHPTWSTVLTIAGHGYTPVYAQGTLLGDVGIFEKVGSVNTPALGAELADVLGRDAPGQGRAALIRSHGSVVVGADIAQAFVLMIHMEENCRRDVLARQIGTPRRFDADEITAARANLWKPNLFAKTWAYHRARLRRPPPH
jgi:L-ribulose-5-phosphate 4-epimerase